MSDILKEFFKLLLLCVIWLLPLFGAVNFYLLYLETHNYFYLITASIIFSITLLCLGMSID